MTFGVVVFPGSNCDYDAYQAIKSNNLGDAKYLWHDQSDLNGCDVVILPGGFSYGDYLRAGAIARFSPIMRSVAAFAQSGGIVIGICNGFQILLEAGLLPGAMRRNKMMRFVCRDVYLKIGNPNSIFTRAADHRRPLRIPIAHAEGNYFADNNTLTRLISENRVVFRYCDHDGKVNDDSNPNGSVDNIAGIINEGGNVLGLMPHPERACEAILGSVDGRLIFESIRKVG